MLVPFHKNRNLTFLENIQYSLDEKLFLKDMNLISDLHL